VNHPHNPVCEVCTRMERERIIKLLEKEQQELVIDQNHNGAAVLRDVVALIKGENK